MNGSIELLKILLRRGRKIEDLDLGPFGFDKLDYLETLLLLPCAFPVEESIDGQLEPVLVSQFIGLGGACGGLELDECSAGADEVEVSDNLGAVAGGLPRAPDRLPLLQEFRRAGWEDSSTMLARGAEPSLFA